MKTLVVAGLFIRETATKVLEDEEGVVYAYLLRLSGDGYFWRAK